MWNHVIKTQFPVNNQLIEVFLKMFFNKRIPSRIIVSLLGGISCFLLFSIRMSLSVAIIAMVNQTSFNHDTDSQSNRTGACSFKNNKSQVHDYQVNDFQQKSCFHANYFFY